MFLLFIYFSPLRNQAKQIGRKITFKCRICYSNIMKFIKYIKMALNG